MKGLFIGFFLLGIYAVLPTQIYAYSITPADVVVSAYVGAIPPPPPEKGGRFSLFGYTSPGAKVSINNPGMYSDTTADSTGYFEFRNFFSQLLIEDICLVAQDQSNRSTMPVCIPPVPSGASLSIGPIIMPPTISLSGDSFFTGDTVTLSGQTTPDTNIKLSMFTDESKTSLQSFLLPIKPVYGATLPKVDIKVNKNGEFTMVVPSSDPQFYRTFAQTIFHQAPSSKSVTLNFNIFPGWFIIIKMMLGFLNALKSRWLEIALLSQVLLLAYWILRRFTHPVKLSSFKALMLRSHLMPMTQQHQLLLQEHEILLNELVLMKSNNALLK